MPPANSAHASEDLTEDPWPAEDLVPPPWLTSDPAPHDPDDIDAWLDRELAQASARLDVDPWLDDDRVADQDPGLADHLPPGPVLAGLAEDRWADGLERLSDDELIGVLRAARRLASWTAAMEIDATRDLLRRRTAEEDAGDTGAALHADAEVAAALTLTTRAADNLLGLAAALDRLPLTRAALAAGDIDLPRATVIADELTGLTDAHAAAVEQAIIGNAPGQTTGELRRAVRRAVQTADPAAARKRKEQALREARVERWTESAGTAALAGRDLPPAEVLSADANLTALAKQLKAAGVEGTMDTLRAMIYLALLSGTPVTALLPANQGSGSPDRDRRGTYDAGGGTPDNPPSAATGSGGTGAPPAGLLGPGGASITGRVNLTLPLATWLGQSEAPGEVPGYGPLDATDSRALADALAIHPRTRWCLTITGPNGRPLAHGCARARPRAKRAARARDPAQWTVTLTPLDSGGCDHAWQTPAYRPTAALRHLVNLRHTTCVFPGCRRPAMQCDADHTIPYDDGGKTCLCNLAPLCRRHHRAKHAPGWRLEQPQPGVLVWHTPAGRTYVTTATQYPM